MLAAHFLRYLIRIGSLAVIDAMGRTHRFSGGPGPSVTVRLHDRALHHRLLFNPYLAAGEAYMDGTLAVEDGTIFDLLELVCRNAATLDSFPLQRLNQQLWRLGRMIHTHNPVTRARRNVAHHYDLSGALYDLFLDADRQYSCAYFVTDNDSLEVAQDNKKLHLAAKLLLQPGQKVLD
ncbi:MAG: class I SAM-dependent methyltransferase, partial [Dongiaceae bacterium]